ncbi:MAG TPA: division/cell wall cluster transcriptional repressor MraZ [Solimonas sp.]|nr:division/cell wall cluster transcriptional repressor MraZ [Solimonas sp.]
MHEGGWWDIVAFKWWKVGESGGRLTTRMLFSGSHHLSIDEKGRLAVPARFRQHLSERCGGQLVVTRGPNPCLEIFPAPEFERLASDIENMPDQLEAEDIKAIMIGFAAEAEMDKQGRILIPPNLRKAAKLEGAVVLMGQIRRFDLWSAGEWETRFGEGSTLFAARADAFRTLKR